MKKRYLLLLLACLLCTLITLPACDAAADDTLKAITKPYIDEYECVDARLGEENLLKEFDYIIISLVDKQNLELSYKIKGGDKRVVKGTYSVNSKTREFNAEIGLLGYTFKEKTKIEKGQFVLELNLFSKPLYMKFRSK